MFDELPPGFTIKHETCRGKDRWYVYYQWGPRENYCMREETVSYEAAVQWINDTGRFQVADQPTEQEHG